MNIVDSNFKKILIINPFGIGDVLFTLPFVRNLKMNLPNVSINYIGNARTAFILELDPNIDKVYVYERDEFTTVYKKSKIAYIIKIFNFAAQIRGERFDAVFDFSLNTSASFFTWLVGIKKRIGFNYKNRSPLLTEKIAFQGFENKHVVNHYLDLLESLGGTVFNRRMQMPVDPKDSLWAEEFLAKSGIDPQRKLVAVLPGAGASWGAGAKFRRWDQVNYAQLVDKIVEKHNAQIILMGDKSEANLCQAVAQSARAQIVEAYGKTTIGQLAALLSKCDLAILNDGGPLHMAVGVGTKTVSIFGPVDEAIYGPFDPENIHRVVSKTLPCRPCYRKFRMTNCSHVSCLKSIQIDDVFKAVDQTFEVMV